VVCTNFKYTENVYPFIVSVKALFGVYLMVRKIPVKSGSHRFTQKRSDIDIIADILSAAKRGAKKTPIMYGCNLSHSQLQVYLQILHEMKLLVFNSKEEGAEQNYFKTTSKGLKFLDAYRALKRLMT
jgi:predicted transcriptional regulator